MSGHTSTQISETVRDLVSHREAWRSAIEIAIEQASDSRDDMDEKGYLKHELAAFDRTFSVLNEHSQSIVTACNSHADLVMALRRLAIVQRHRMAYGGGTVHVGWACKSCDSDWDRGEPEKHKPECFAALAKLSPVKR